MLVLFLTGMAFDAQGNLIVCDAARSLVLVDVKSKKYKLLTDNVQGRKFAHLSAVVVHQKTGIIYFTEASNVRYIPTIDKLFVEGRKLSSLWSHNPQTGVTDRVLVNEFRFANGLAFVPGTDEKVLAISDSSIFAIKRYYLEEFNGVPAGTFDTLIDGLDAAPANLAVVGM
jgi:sugar lactone lactonase YvrE